jgi:MerR family transcriptional regulator, heat shock protein HspR
MNERQTHTNDQPCYVISVAAKMVGMHAQSLRNYERMGLIQPGRSQGRVRLYSQSDIERLLNIQRMVQDLGVNLAGVDVIMNMRQRMQQMEREMALLREELQAYRDRTLPAVPGAGGRRSAEM